MPWHNKVLGYPTEIFDFVLGDGSYYSLFAVLGKSRITTNGEETNNNLKECADG